MQSQKTDSKQLLKPVRIGFTYGDLGGIGPEIFNKFYQSQSSNELYQIKLIDEDLNPFDKIPLGQPSGWAGEHAYKTLLKAHQMLINKELDYLVTGPLSKQSLWLAGIQVEGQTELLAQINNLNKDDIEMFFILENFRLVLATRHVSINRVSNELNRRFKTVLINSVKAMQNIFSIHKPSIAVAGLNPHAGESGILGNEEKEFIIPQITQANQTLQASINGPFAADALLAQAAQKFLAREKPDYDLFVTAYHDQALPLIKGLGGLKAINLTTGLPYIRVSVDHGTGFDIAGMNKASYLGLESCLKFCLKNCILVD